MIRERLPSRAPRRRPPTQRRPPPAAAGDRADAGFTGPRGRDRWIGRRLGATGTADRRVLVVAAAGAGRAGLRGPLATRAAVRGGDPGRHRAAAHRAAEPGAAVVRRQGLEPQPGDGRRCSSAVSPWSVGMHHPRGPAVHRRRARSCPSGPAGGIDKVQAVAGQRSARTVAGPDRLGAGLGEEVVHRQPGLHHLGRAAHRDDGRACDHRVWCSRCSRCSSSCATATRSGLAGSLAAAARGPAGRARCGAARPGTSLAATSGPPSWSPSSTPSASASCCSSSECRWPSRWPRWCSCPRSSRSSVPCCPAGRGTWSPW